ncbi:uncharacterized protein LOC133174797 [Saccostrea echinata]|uniref:uncharacterized protein LOC133174797 n=1 Tax=Saccostrea echinata TaxID=191078 RepID=UPI002A80F164|nr:uncharacterized protein LOC133174797 [Saccostrea echinata]
MIDIENNVAKCCLCSMETTPGNIQVNRLIALALQAQNADQNNCNKDEDTIKEFEMLANDLRNNVSEKPNPGETVSLKRDELKQSITEFYCKFIEEVTTYLKEQSADILSELDSIFEKYEHESAMKEKRKQMFAEEIETLFKLFSSVYTDKTQLLMEDLVHEMSAYFGKCRSLLDKIGVVECDVNFLSGYEQKDLVLATNFGALVDQTTTEERNNVDDCTENTETNISQPSVANTEENFSGERSSDDVTNNATCDVASEAYPQTESDLNTSHDEEIENESQTVVQGTENSTNSDDYASGSQSVLSPTNDINSITICPTDPQSMNSSSNYAEEEEPPPPYWMAIGENGPSEQSSFLSNIGCRNVNPRRSPRLSSSSSSSVSSSRRSGQGTNIPQRGSFNLQNQGTVHTSNPLQYATHGLSIRTQLPDDFRTGPIVAIAWMKDRLVLVDRFNSKLKMFLETGEFLHSLKFVDGEPWDVCAINVVEMLNNPLTCGITIPRKRFVMLIQILDGRTMLIGHRLATRRGYSCLAYDQKNGALVCGVSSPFGTAGIDVINTSGVLLAQFPLPAEVLVRSIDVSIKDVIIICDWRKNNVIFLNKSGAVIGQFSGSLEPVGTCTDGRGFLLVADSKSNAIHILTMKGEIYGKIKSSCPIVRPKEINVRPDGPPRLALSHGSMFVEVFDLFESETSLPIIPTAPPSLQ